MNLSSKIRSSPKEAMASLLAEEMASCMSHSKSSLGGARRQGRVGF